MEENSSTKFNQDLFNTDLWLLLSECNMVLDGLPLL